MNHSDFSIGLEFWCGDRRWRCTDVGTRVITAICLEPRNMVRSEPDPNDKAKRILTECVSPDPRDLNGPPYGVAECVFNEYDMEACSVEREADDPALNEELKRRLAELRNGTTRGVPAQEFLERLRRLP